MAAVLHGTSIASRSGTPAAMGILPSLATQEPQCAGGLGLRGWRARCWHLWVLQVGGALWDGVQGSRVSLCPCSTPPSPWLGGSGEPGHDVLQVWQGAPLPGGLCCILIVIAAPSAQGKRLLVRKSSEAKHRVTELQASHLGSFRPTISISGCETPVWGCRGV